MNLSPTQRHALQALARHGGEGVRTKRGTLLAAGVELGHGADDDANDDAGAGAISWLTWSRLVSSGHLEQVADKRYRLTDSGLAVAAGRAVARASCKHCGKPAEFVGPCGVGGCPIAADL